MEKTEKKKSFMINVAIVMFSQIAVKLLGLVYRMVITNIRGFGDVGNGYLNSGFQVYTLLLAISSVGIPNAIAKMTSERNAVGDYAGAHKIFRSAFLLFSIVGITASLLLFFGAGFISTTIIHMPGAKYVLMCLAPSIMFVCLSSVIRGYFVGMENMKATSTSQVLEQFFKCFLTIGIVYALASFPQILESIFSDINADKRAIYMASGAQIATTLATIISFIYLILFYNHRKKAILKKVSKTAVPTITSPLKDMFKNILLISIPISLGSIISAINRIIDTATITRGIEIAFKDMIPAFAKNASIINPTLEQLQAEAVRLSGLLAKSDTLINLPLAINISFATVLVPSIAGALAKGDKKTAAEKITYSLLISILIVLPCAVGYIALAKPIYGLLYPNAKLGFDLLQLSAIALIFTALNQTISGSLQGIGKVYAPATGLFIGCVAKFILNVTLIRLPQINIYGAPISSIACQVISFSYGFTVLCRNIRFKITFKKYLMSPIISAAIMGITAFALHALVLLLAAPLGGYIANVLAVFVSIAVSAIVYFALVFKFRILSESEVIMLPAGVKVLNKLKKLGFYK